jgi:hypothetical protein
VRYGLLRPNSSECEHIYLSSVAKSAEQHDSARAYARFSAGRFEVSLCPLAALVVLLLGFYRIDKRNQNINICLCLGEALVTLDKPLFEVLDRIDGILKIAFQ